MDLEEIAIKYKNFNGMELVDFSEVALPIYRISAIALVQEKVELHTIDEFVLRAIHLGFKSLPEIGGLLGISDLITRTALSSLIQANLVSETDNCKVSLTKMGLESAGNYAKIRPSEEQVVFDFDGILREVKLTSIAPYLSPKEVKDQGLIEIRAIPARRPEVDEIEIQDVGRALSKFTAIEDSNKTLLRIRDISRAVRLFYKGIMLMYKDQSYSTYEAAFYIDGAISSSHGMSFLKSEGLDRLGLIQKIEESPRKTLESEYPEYCPTEKPKQEKSTKKKTKLKRPTLSLAKPIVSDNEIDDSSLIDEKVDNEPKIHTLAVYDHPDVLYGAINKAQDSLIIISPWITRAVVDGTFIRKLDELLRRNVDVKIGFGIGNDDRYDEYAQSLLSNLSKRYKNFTLKELGDTHAKVLIKDDEFYVITSFNWLSFKGDPKKKFREEWGNYVEGVELVRKFRNEIEERFS